MPRAVPEPAPATPQDPQPVEIVDEIVADATTTEPGATARDFIERWIAPGGGE